MTIQNQLNGIRLILDALLSTVEASGTMGAPGGHLYAAMMTQGCTLEQFEKLMGILVDSGRIVKRGDCYFKA